MDLSDDEVQQRAEADRREVDPPIQVEMATWSPGGQLDWFVKDRQEWWVGYAVLTAVNDGSELLNFVPRAAHSDNLPLSLVAPFGASKLPRLAPRINSRARVRARAGSCDSTFRPATGELISSLLAIS